MEYRNDRKQEPVSALGFGCMRLSKRGRSIDLEKAEKEILAQALENYGSTRAIARVLKVSQPTIVRKLNKYGLTTEKQ